MVANPGFLGIGDGEPIPVSTTSISLAAAQSLAPVTSTNQKDCLKYVYPWKEKNPILQLQPGGKCALFVLGQRKDADRIDVNVTGRDALEPCCSTAYEIDKNSGQLGCSCKGSDCTNTTMCLYDNREILLIGAVACTPPNKTSGVTAVRLSSGALKLVLPVLLLWLTSSIINM